MSDANATAEPTITEEDITVRKSYGTDEFPVPTVSFELSSGRDDEAMVRLIDIVPDSVPPKDLGFHPDYGSDHWSIEDDNPVFERRLDPGEEHRTVYGIRTSDHEPEQFMSDPRLDVRGLDDDTDADEVAVDKTDADETAVETGTPGRDSSQAARNVISGESDINDLAKPDDEIDNVDISGAKTTDTTEMTETAEPSETSDETEEHEEDEHEEDEHEEDEHEEDRVMTEDSIGAALAAEFREGNLNDSDHELLVEKLTEEDTGNEVRLTHLQSRISDLEAYTDALEEFIDEHGPARQLIENMSDQLETIENEFDALDDRTTENESAIETLEERTEENVDIIETLEERTEENESVIETLEERTEENKSVIETLDEGITDVQADITDTQESVEGIRADIEEINDWREQISSVLGSASENK